MDTFRRPSTKINKFIMNVNHISKRINNVFYFSQIKTKFMQTNSNFIGPCIFNLLPKEIEMTITKSFNVKNYGRLLWKYKCFNLF